MKSATKKSLAKTDDAIRTEITVQDPLAVKLLNNQLYISVMRMYIQKYLVPDTASLFTDI